MNNSLAKKARKLVKRKYKADFNNVIKVLCELNFRYRIKYAFKIIFKIYNKTGETK